MKIFPVVFLTILALVMAIPPSRNPKYNTLSRQQQPPPASAPYTASGWQPQGARLRLPSSSSRQIASSPAAVSSSYGPPSPSYGPPAQTYGPPTTTELPTTTDIDFITEEPEAESFKVTSLQGQKQKEPAENIERGQYYLLLPDGRLQRVIYMTSADLKKMAYSAQLKYQDVEPLTGPIYTTANAPFIPVFQK